MQATVMALVDLVDLVDLVVVVVVVVVVVPAMHLDGLCRFSLGRVSQESSR